MLRVSLPSAPKEESWGRRAFQVTPFLRPSLGGCCWVLGFREEDHAAHVHRASI